MRDGWQRDDVKVGRDGLKKKIKRKREGGGLVCECWLVLRAQ